MQTPTRAFQALHEVAVAAAGLRDPFSLAALVVDRARDLLEADAAALYWWFPDAELLRTLAHNDPHEKTPEPPFKTGEGAAGRAFQEAKPIRVDDYRSWPEAVPTSVMRGIESGLAVPLMVSHRAVGALGVFNRRTREWTTDEENLLVLFAAQVAPAMEAARLTQETIEQAHNFRALHEVAIAAGGLRDLGELGRLVVDRARQLLKTESATLRWWDPATSRLRLLASIPGLQAPGEERIPAGAGTLGQAFERREPVIIENYAEAGNTVEWAIAEGVRSAMGVPVMAREEPLGALGVATYSERRFTREEIQLLTLLAAQVGPALEAARLYTESERRRREAEALAELVRRGAGQDDTERATAMITEQACRLVGADYSVLLLSNDLDSLEVSGSFGTRTDSWQRGRATTGNGHPDRVLAAGATVVIEEIAAGEHYPLHRAEGGKSAIGTPLAVGAEVIGVMVLGWRKSLEPNPDRVQLLEAVAGYAATIIDNVRNHERERLLATEAAARSGELAAVIDQIPDGVYVTDLEGRIVLINRAALEMMQVDNPSLDVSGGISGFTVLDPVTREEIPPERLVMKRALRGERVTRAESIVRREGRPEIWLDSSAVPLRSLAGDITGALVVFSDITRERTLIHELAASEERFRSLYGMIACGVLVQDSQGRVLDANRPAEEILGWSLEEMRGKKTGSLWEAVTESGRPLPLSERPTMQALKTRRQLERQVLGVKCRNGELRWLQIDTIPVFHPDGSALQVVSSFIDISERKAAQAQLVESEAKYRLLFDRNPEAMWVAETATGRFLAVNDTAVARYGYSRAEFGAMTAGQLLAPRKPTRSRARTAAATDTGPGHHLRKDGSQFAVELSSHPLEFGGSEARLVIAVDVSEKMNAQDRLTESELTLRTIFDQAPIGLARIDLRGLVQESNLALRTMLGYARKPLVGLSFDKLLRTADGTSADLVAEFLKGDRDHYRAELPVKRRDGTERWGSVSLSLVRGRDLAPLYLIGMLEDITERKAQTELLEYQALHDSLTDLPNRTLLNDRLQQAILTAQREDRQLALLIMDLDRFKDVNDTFGHHLGDLLLQQVGPRIMAQLRESDTVARLGGDEFAVVLPTADDEAGATLAGKRILKALEEPFEIDGRRLEVGGSIGIAITPQHGADPATLMRRADIAMYVAKRTHAGFTVYAPEHDKHSARRLALMGELREALDSDQLVLHYQPQLDFRGGQVVGVEALIRWQHPRHGLMPPSEFMPVAEETGLIVALSEWAIGAALSESRKWGIGQTVPVAVNLTMQNIQDPNLPVLIAGLLERWSATAAQLKIEVTEAALTADPTRSGDVIARLREMGVKVTIDDFGSGFSSLAYLKQLAVDELKIDRSLVIGITPGTDEIAIVRSAIDLGHSLGLVVVAEGVETQAVWDALAELGCDVGQGFLVTRPLPQRQLLRWLAAGRPRRSPEPTH